MRYFIVLTAALALLLPVTVAAQQFEIPRTLAVDTPEQADAIPLYGDETPGSLATENWEKVEGWPIYAVRNVTMPSLTPYLPEPGTATGAAVVVAPGGAFVGLAITREGTDVAQALAARGIAAFVLKYRLIPTPAGIDEANAFADRRMRERNEDPMQGSWLEESSASEDARAALAMVRARADDWGIDPDRVGMIGFSAGAMTARHAAIHNDPAERPDFFGYIYGPQNGETVPADAPPMFAAIAVNDPLFRTMGFPIVEEWQAAGLPVELHAYGQGRHGFGLGFPGTTTTMMLDQFVAWMDMLGFNQGEQDQ